MTPNHTRAPPPARLGPTATILALVALTFAGCTTATASSHLAIMYGPERVNVSVDVAMSPSDRPAAALYAANAALHPDFYSALDQLVQWGKSSGTAVDATYSPSFADFFVARIGGLPTDAGTAYWSLLVNGTQSQVGVGHVALHGGERIQWTLTPIHADPAPAKAPTLTVPARVSTGAATVRVNGTVDTAATLTFLPASLKLAPIQAGAAWSIQVPLAYGRTNLTVVASNDGGAARATTVLVRLAPVKVQVDYKMAPGHTARDDTVLMDLGAFQSAVSYAGKDLQHPGFATVHDAMVEWTNQTDVQVSYEYSNSLGYSVAQIDGVGSPLSGAPIQPWCYDFNGASASKGISTQHVNAGDVITWKLGCA